MEENVEPEDVGQSASHGTGMAIMSALVAL